MASIDSLYACSYPMPTETSISMHITPIAMDNAVRLVRTRRRDRFIMPVRIKSLGRIATPLFYYQRRRYRDYCRRARRCYPYWECFGLLLRLFGFRIRRSRCAGNPAGRNAYLFRRRGGKAHHRRCGSFGRTRGHSPHQWDDVCGVWFVAFGIWSAAVCRSAAVSMRRCAYAPAWR